MALQLLLLLCTCVTKGSNTYLSYAGNRIVLRVDTPPSPKGPLPYPFSDESNGVPMYNPDGGLMLSTPPNIKTDVQYNPVTGKYDIYQKMGSLDYRPPTEMDSDQYEDYMFNQAEKSYFKQKTEATPEIKQ